MTVYENLSNYDIPSGFNLSAEDEEELFNVVASIIPELDKLKNNKVETRKYFKRCLRYSSNVRDDNALKGRGEDFYDEGENYTPLPGEYTWNSNLLQPVLLQVLEPEEVSYGYICNFLHEDLEARGVEGFQIWTRITDRMVRFAHQFNIEEIKKKAWDMNDPTERVLYLNKVKAKYDMFEHLPKEQMEWVYYPFGDQLNALLWEAKEAVDIWKTRQMYEYGRDPLSPVPSPISISTLTPENYSIDEERVLGLLLPIFDVANDPSLEIPSLEKLDNARLIFQNEFNLFLEKTNMVGWQNTRTVLSYVDDWARRMRSLIDNAYYKCPRSEFIRVMEHDGEEKGEDLSINNLFFAEFALQELLVVACEYKANLLFNNRESEDILYFLDEGGYESVVERRKVLGNSFGKLDQLKELSEPVVNIQVFYKKIALIIHTAVMEGIKKCSNNTDQFALPQTLESLERDLKQWHIEYLEMIRNTEDLVTCPQLEDRTWYEVTKYCFVEAFLKTERRLLSSTSLRHLCNIRSLLSFQFEGIDGILNKMIENMISKTGDEQYDEHYNDLGTINLDLVEKVIPPFPAEIIDEKFVTFSEWKEACGIIEDEENEATITRIIEGVYSAGLERDWNEVKRRLKEEGIPFVGKRITGEGVDTIIDEVSDSLAGNEKNEENANGYQYKDLPAVFFTSLHALFERHGVIEGITKDELEKMICQANVKRIYKMPNKTRVRFVLIKLKDHFPEQWQIDVAANLGKKVNEIFRGYNVPPDFESDYNKIIKSQ